MRKSESRPEKQAPGIWPIRYDDPPNGTLLRMTDMSAEVWKNLQVGDLRVFSYEGRDRVMRCVAKSDDEAVFKDAHHSTSRTPA